MIDYSTPPTLRNETLTIVANTSSQQLKHFPITQNDTLQPELRKGKAVISSSTILLPKHCLSLTAAARGGAYILR